MELSEASPKLIISITSKGVTTQCSLNTVVNYAIISTIVSKNINEALNGEYWTLHMKAELNQFKRNGVWELVPRLDDCNVISTKWVHRKKEDEEGNIATNKLRIVTQGYNQEKGIDFVQQTPFESCVHLLVLKDLNFFKWM